MDTLRAAIDETLSGHGGVVLLRGEPGAGKTRLAQEAYRLAGERGMLLAVGRCHAPDISAPFTPILDVVARLHEAAPGALRETATARWPYLAHLLPHEKPLPLSTIEPDGRQRLFRAVDGLVAALAERQPVAIFLDDLQWADSSSLGLVAHLARNAAARRLLLLGTYRDSDIGQGHPLTGLLRDLERDEILHAINVQPFDERGTAAFVADALGTSDLPAGMAAYVHRVSDGNAFFVRHLLPALQQVGAARAQDGTWQFDQPSQAPMPSSVKALVDGRLATLSEGATESLREAAVLGPTFSIWTLQAVAGRSMEEIEAGIEEAEAAGLLRALDAETEAFDHALTQSVLLADLSPRRLRRLHLAAAEALEGSRRQTGDAAALAWHFQEGGVPERALPYALLAGDKAAAVYAHREAATQYRTVLTLAAQTGDSAREALGYERLGGVLRSLGELDAAAAACDGAITCYNRLDDLEGEGRATAALADVYVARGAPADAHARVRAMLERFEGQPPSPAVAALYLALAPSRDAGRPEDYLAATERATEVARALGDERLLATAGVRRGLMLMVLGRPEAARQVLEDVLPGVERWADYATRNLGLGVLSELLKLAGEMRACLARREQIVALAEEAGDPAWLVVAHAQLGEVLMLTGEWRAARTHLERAVDLSASLPDPHATAFALTCLGELCSAEGRTDEAAEHLHRCLAAVQAAGYGHWVRIVERLLAQRDLLLDRPIDALSRLRAVARDEDESHAGTQTVLAWAAREAGEIAEAVMASDRALTRARTRGERLDLCEALIVHGALAGDLGETGDATSAFAKALALARAMPNPYAEGRAHYAWGTTLSEQDPNDARAHLEAALTLFTALGAVPSIQRTERALAQLPPANP
jgi:tetratricopeptide (TPR) repeat protein